MLPTPRARSDWLESNVQECSREEEWRDIPQWESVYQVSDRGRIRSVDRTVIYPDGKLTRFKSRVLKAAPTYKGYLRVVLHSQERRKTMPIHHAVLAAFVGLRPPGAEGCHNDGDQRNNAPSNLRWGTSSENSLDQVEHGTHGFASRPRCKWGHLLIEPNAKPGPGTARICRSCRWAFGRRYYMRTKGVEVDFQAVSDRYYAEIMKAA